MNWNKPTTLLASDLPAADGPPPRRALLRLRDMVLLVFMGLVAFLVYSNTLEAPYVLDDEPHIQLNSSIRLTDLDWDKVLAAGFESVNPNRPVANISFALNYYFHRYEVRGFHAVNILIHVLTGFLFYLLIRETIRLPRFKNCYGAGRWLPFAAAFVWLLHPVQTQAVTYIVQRMTSLAAMFYLLAMFCYVRGRLAQTKWHRNLFFVSGLIAGLLALGSKETAATLPFFVLLYEWYFFQDLGWGWLRRNTVYLLFAVIVLVGLVWFYLGNQPLTAVLSAYHSRDFTLTQRLLTEPRVVMFYVSLLLFPHPARLNLDHDFGLSFAIFRPPETFLAIAAIIGALGLAIIMARQQRLLSFCILWFLGNLVIESSVIGLEIIFEHRNYLPSMFFILFFVILAGRVLKVKRLQASVLTVVLVLLSASTYERNWVWEDEVRLWSDCAEKSPKKARPHLNLGTSMFKQGRISEAIINYSEALRIDPHHAIAHNNLGFIMAGFERIKVAITHYSEALRIKPNYEKAQFNLKAALNHNPGVMKGGGHTVPTDFAESHFERGLIMETMGNTEEALGHFYEALQIDPDHAEAHFHRGTLLAEQERLEEAGGHFYQVLRINPDDVNAHFNLGNVLAGKGEFDEAISHFSAVLRLQPTDLHARRNLVTLRRIVASKTGRSKKDHYSDPLRIKPDYGGVHFNLESESGRM